MHSAPRRRKRRLALALYWVALLALFLALGELGARLMGHRPYHVSELKIKVEPGGKFFAPHPTLGYTHLSGRFQVTLADGYTFTVTHLTNTLRATHPPSEGAANRPALWVMGCSFVHGWSLNDEDTLPWQLQLRLPEYEVHNFGVSGYGTLHSLLQYGEFRQMLPKPAAVVVDYAYFHDERNTLTRARRKAVAPYNQLGPITLPWARLDERGAPVIHHTPVAYREWPLQRHSALVHLLEQRYCDLEAHRARGQQVSIALLKQFAARCRADGVEFVVAGITRGKDAERVLQACAEAGIPTVDISVSLSEPGSRNLPHDDHPSARSQQEYARKLAEYLRQRRVGARE